MCLWAWFEIDSKLLNIFFSNKQYEFEDMENMETDCVY